MPSFVRLYTGDDGQSHLEDLDPEFVPSDELAGALEAAPVGTTRIMFRRNPPGHFQDFHVAPRRQYIISLSGESEIVTGDGTVRKFRSGDVLLAEDLTGKGHTTRVVSSEPRFYAVVPLAD